MPVSQGINTTSRDHAPRLLRAWDDERRRIAHELHDDISQRIALLSIGVDTLRQELADVHTNASGRLAVLLERAHDLAERVRHLSHELHPTNLDHLGLKGAVGAMCHEFTTCHGVTVGLHDEGTPEGIPDDVARVLFRVVEEGLRNVARHSGAATATVEIAGTDQEVRLSVEDRGRGFDVDAASSKGLGLMSMRVRLAAIGARWTIGSAPSRGTRIDVTVPLARPAAAD